MQQGLKRINLILFILLIHNASLSQAYIPSSKMILDKVVDNALKTPLYVEQEVHLVSSQSSVFLKEQWLFESENSFRVIVHGEKDLQDLIHFQINVFDNQRSSSLTGSTQTSRSSHPLFEKVFFIKNADNLKRFLVQQEIVGNDIFNSQNFKKIPGNNGFQHQAEPFLRLGRVGGIVSYIFGSAPRDESRTPGFWVEQDLFNILKLRNAQGEEFRAEKVVSFSRGARWSKEMQFSWGAPQSTAQIQTSTVKVADSNHRQLFQKRMDRRGQEFERHSGKNLVEEFYSRFR